MENLLRVLPCCAERRGKYGGRRHWTGIDRVGTKVKPEWLQAWLRNPRIYDPGTGMPHYRFNDSQVATLSGFLLGKAEPDLLANVHLDAATPEQIAMASAWFPITAALRVTKSRVSRSPRTSRQNSASSAASPLRSWFFYRACSTLCPITLPARSGSRVPSAKD